MIYFTWVQTADVTQQAGDARLVVLPTADMREVLCEYLWMNYGSKILIDMSRLIALFEPHCEDRTTLATVNELLGDRSRWHEAHALFSVIRKKTNRASAAGNKFAESQYLFEEICAKTLYNLSGESAPFDSDSPYWIVPNAISFARRAGISDTACIDSIMLG